MDRGRAEFDVRVHTGRDDAASVASPIPARPELRVPQPDRVELAGEIDASNIALIVRDLEGIARPASGILFVDCAPAEFLDHRTVVALERWAADRDCAVEMLGARPLMVKLVEIVGCEYVSVRTVDPDASGYHPPR